MVIFPGIVIPFKSLDHSFVADDLWKGMWAGLSKNRRDRTERPSRSLRPYRRPDDETGRTTGQQLLPVNESLVVGAMGLT